MWSTLLAVAWAGAGSPPHAGSATVTDFIISLALTGLVAWLAHDNERQKARRRERELARAIPVAGIH